MLYVLVINLGLLIDHVILSLMEKLTLLRIKRTIVHMLRNMRTIVHMLTKSSQFTPLHCPDTHSDGLDRFLSKNWP